MTSAQSWAQIPLELRQRAQWAYTNPNVPEINERKAPRTHNGRKASVTSPSDFLTFEQASDYARQIGGSIGYILTASDPFACIDLDVKDATNEPDPHKWTKQEDFNRYWDIAQHFNAYTERSQSGKGLHIWLKGKIGRGARRDGVEVYSQERFIISTGDVIINQPVKDAQETLIQMVESMRVQSDKVDRVELVEINEELTDEEIYERASTASNAEKFLALCNATSCTGTGDKKVHGSYTSLNFPSQSEADLALMSIFAFYSKSNEQCRRLFRYSKLGQRDKAIKDNRYLDRTLSLIRNRQAFEDGVSSKIDKEVNALITDINQKALNRGASLLHVTGSGEPVQAPAPPSAAVAALGPIAAPTAKEELAWPPGLAGQIAYYIYQSAPRPVREVAIVATLGLLSGICGKAFCIPQSGLNLYIILIAKSAIGKEAMHSGLASLTTAVSLRNPAMMKFVDFTEFASGPALQKACAQNSSFVNVQGEWGRRLKRMSADDGRDGPMSSLRTVMTNLYQKSGPQSIVGGIGYSNQEGNIASITGVAYSMIGETTPNTFYEALTQSMMDDGFLSRFNLIEYNGMRPPLNVNPLTEPSKPLGDALSDLVTHVVTLLSAGQSCRVARTENAAARIQAFELECDAQINATKDETWRQMYNRASLKMMRVSALLAVSKNWIDPVIDDECVEWALDLVKRDMSIMAKRIQRGDVGKGDDQRMRKVMSVIEDYCLRPVPAGYGVPEGMPEDRIVPKKYIVGRLCGSTLFTSHKGGASAGIDQTVKSLIELGNLVETDKTKVYEKYHFSGKCYRIVSIHYVTEAS